MIDSINLQKIEVRTIARFLNELASNFWTFSLVAKQVIFHFVNS